MQDPRNARPVSGEMMTIPGGERSALNRGPDVIEAEYVEVLAEPRAQTVQPVAPSAPSGMSMLNKADHSDGPLRAHGGPIFWLIGTVLIATAFWVSGGHALVRQTAMSGPTEIKPSLSIANLRTHAGTQDGKATLVVDGHVVNDGSASGDFSALVINVTDQHGRVFAYRLGTVGRSLAPGTKFAFSSRLDMPMDGVRTVAVTIE